jgi:hypothetical protein
VPLESCIRQLFEGQVYPPPEAGCIVVNIPISFTIKEHKDAADAGP